MKVSSVSPSPLYCKEIKFWWEKFHQDKKISMINFLPMRAGKKIVFLVKISLCTVCDGISRWKKCYFWMPKICCIRSLSLPYLKMLEFYKIINIVFLLKIQLENNNIGLASPNF